MSRVLIIEPRAHGHHFSLYLRNVLREGLRQGWEIVLLTTRDAMEHRAAQSLTGELRSRVEVVLMATPRQLVSSGALALMCNQWLYVRACVKGWERISDRRFDAVLMMDLDSADKWISLMGSPFGAVPLCGVLVHAKAHRLSSARGLRAALIRLSLLRLLRLASIRAVCVIDCNLTSYRDRLPRAQGEKLVVVAEPAAIEPQPIDRALARSRLGICEADFVILVYGALSRRKGLHLLIDAISGTPQLAVTVVLAGQVDGEVQALLNSKEVQLLVADSRFHMLIRFVSDTEEVELMSAADVVWLGYAPEFDGQSALLPLAASYSVPVIARLNTPVGDLVKKHKLGFALVPEDQIAVINALRQLAADPELRERLRAGAKSFVDSRPMRGFAGAICSAVLG